MISRLFQRRNVLPAIAAIAVMVVFCAAADACPNCAKGMAEQSDGGDLVAGFQWSILFMMAMPFTILSFFGGYVYLEVRRAKTRQQDADQRADDGNASQ